MGEFELLEQALTRRIERVREEGPAGSADEAVPGHASPRDRLQDPGVAEAVRRARDAMRDVPDVRPDRVASLRKALADGTLPLDGEALAGPVLQESLLNELL